MKLSERVAAATGPDRELDEAIADAIYTNKRRTCIAGLSDDEGGMWMWETPDGHIQNALRFTASMDAVMAIAPEGRRMTVQQRRSYEPFWVCFMRDGGTEFDATGKNDSLVLAALEAILQARNL